MRHGIRFGVIALSAVLAAGAPNPAMAGDPLAASRSKCFGAIGPNKAQEVVEACSRIIEAKAPDAKMQADAYYHRGKARQHNGKIYEAKQDWNRALRLNINHVEARLKLARWSMGSHSYDFALSAYRRVLQTQPDNADAYFGEGWVLSHMSRFDDALESLRKAASLRPGMWQAYVVMARIHARRKEQDAALDNYASAIAAYAPATESEFLRLLPRPEVARAGYLYRLGRTKAAIKDVSSVLEPDRPDPWLLKIRAEYYQAIDKQELALADYQRVIERAHGPAAMDALYHSALIYQKLGKAEAAIEAMERMIRFGQTKTVLKLQVHLRNNGYSDVEIDGRYSVNMRDALRACMASKGCIKSWDHRG